MNETRLEENTTNVARRAGQWPFCRLLSCAGGTSARGDQTMSGTLHASYPYCKIFVLISGCVLSLRSVGKWRRRKDG